VQYSFGNDGSQTYPVLTVSSPSTDSTVTVYSDAVTTGLPAGVIVLPINNGGSHGVDDANSFQISWVDGDSISDISVQFLLSADQIAANAAGALAVYFYSDEAGNTDGWTITNYKGSNNIISILITGRGTIVYDTRIAAHAEGEERALVSSCLCACLMGCACVCAAQSGVGFRFFLVLVFDWWRLLVVQRL